MLPGATNLSESLTTEVNQIVTGFNDVFNQILSNSTGSTPAAVNSSSTTNSTESPVTDASKSVSADNSSAVPAVTEAAPAPVTS